MNVASLENCKRLYELSGWDDTDFAYDAEDQLTGYVSAILMSTTKYTPAYHAGYLLRKLQPLTIQRGRLFVTYDPGNSKWKAGFAATYDRWHDEKGLADTPENALALLAIKLFEENILERRG